MRDYGRVFALVIAIAALAAPLAVAQDDPHFEYKGATSCRGCHLRPTFPPDFVLLNEATRWERDDKHFMAVRLLFGVLRDKEGRLRLDPGSPAGAVGLNMLTRLKVLTPEELETAVTRAEEMNPKLQTAQDNTREARERYFRALLEASDESDKFYLEFLAAEESVQRLEQDYLQPLLDKSLASETGRGCLACHADLPKESFAPGVDATTFLRESLRDGVSCEACHGPSSEWWKDHIEKAWRTKSPSDKAALGLNDLRHPATRAEQCYSCHIGDAKQGKFIEHAWYMAGHPPLPSIELETYAREMPRHWRYLSEKRPFDKRDEFVAAVKNDPERGFEIDTKQPRTKEVLVGGVVALRKSVALLADIHQRDKALVIPDFAAFDCLACHQELGVKPVITRDEQKFDPFIPGRPNIPRWSFALADIAVEVADEPAVRRDFDANILAWREVLTRQPFGDRQKMQPVADDLQSLLKSLETRLARSETTAETSATAYERLKQSAQSELLDFHSARQTVWAMQVIGPEGGHMLPATLAYPAESEEPSEVAQYLKIRLPAGSSRHILDDDNLRTLLQRIDAYEPERFRSLMQNALR
jgi:hypothetical protein